MNRITEFTELVQFLPALETLYPTLEGKWDTEAPFHEFTARLISSFTPKSFYFGQLDDQGNICYFLVAFPLNDRKLFCWLSYVDRKFHEQSKSWFQQITKIIQETSDYKTVEFSSLRLTSSFRRWATKLGAKPIRQIYEIQL